MSFDADIIKVGCTDDADESARIAALEIALAESVRLQSHYAELLNAYDGGHRLIFASSDEWLKRLQDC